MQRLTHSISLGHSYMKRPWWLASFPGLLQSQLTYNAVASNALAVILASFPDSPGTRICIVGRARYLFYVSKTLPFCFSSILITLCLRRKHTGLSPQYIFVFRGSLGMRLKSQLMHWKPPRYTLAVIEEGLGTRLATMVFSCSCGQGLCCG